MEDEIDLCRGLNQTPYIKAHFEKHIESEYKICPNTITTAIQYHKIELDNCISLYVCLQ